MAKWKREQSGTDGDNDRRDGEAEPSQAKHKRVYTRRDGEHDNNSDWSQDKWRNGSRAGASASPSQCAINSSSAAFSVAAADRSGNNYNHKHEQQRCNHNEWWRSTTTIATLTMDKSRSSNQEGNASDETSRHARNPEEMVNHKRQDGKRQLHKKDTRPEEKKS
eukprot:CAMPEP_0168256536 /NCGR_PEP_ID=MMETSP0141_2-20121125/5937_1 /TAXON_ID=44445 /ORGANISM="Pseudo-nitzschia australis, Strain 10249 10 AB" /LENGTH=163 /DNA_ID=CAMNT_0008193303 /DNA_START=871 /DNA_END=1358 /DNA_ORIENTATION=-